MPDRAIAGGPEGNRIGPRLRRRHNISQGPKRFVCATRNHIRRATNQHHGVKITRQVEGQIGEQRRHGGVAVESQQPSLTIRPRLGHNIRPDGPRRTWAVFHDNRHAKPLHQPRRNQPRDRIRGPAWPEGHHNANGIALCLGRQNAGGCKTTKNHTTRNLHDPVSLLFLLIPSDRERKDETIPPVPSAAPPAHLPPHSGSWRRFRLGCA